MTRRRVGEVVLDVDGAVARALIDRPAAKNALSPAVLEGLDAAVDAATDAGCAVLVISGAGGTLSAGADLPHLETLIGDEAAVTAYIASIGAVLDRIEDAPFVSVAVVGEYALAGGCEILLACDLAVVAEEARIGDRHLEYGLLPGAGGSVRLPRALPAAQARRLLFTGEMIDGATAARWGLVSHAVPGAELDGAVEALVARLARHSGEALARMKRMYRGSSALPAPRALAAERVALVEHLMTSPAAAEGLAAFRAGRKPDFSTVHSPLPGGAMTRTDDGRRAVSGRWFEDLEVGTVVQHVTRRTVTETDNVLFTTMTMNPAPLHLDADYAAGTEFGRPLVNSMFTLALVVGLSVPELTLGTIVAQLGLTDVAFPAPVFPGDTIRVETEVVEARASRSRADAGIVVFEHRAHNQRGELVCRARRTGLMHRRPTDSTGTQS